MHGRIHHSRYTRTVSMYTCMPWTCMHVYGITDKALSALPSYTSPRSHVRLFTYWGMPTGAFQPDVIRRHLLEGSLPAVADKISVKCIVFSTFAWFLCVQLYQCFRKTTIYILFIDNLLKFAFVCMYGARCRTVTCQFETFRLFGGWTWAASLAL